uniref:Zinc finger, CCHC-type n=1 Tax=Tanacetum cinerariifolium TaxID=118510 RepID=A0A6L2N5U4_TANCI|nr:zinc finger, CCHC-type [Tanacetum cinerariifolium]
MAEEDALLAFQHECGDSFMEQYNELLTILGRFTQHKMNMDRPFRSLVSLKNFHPSWKDFKHTLKHLKEELTHVELGSHLRIKESLKMQDSDKPKGNNVAGPSVVNMVDHNNYSRYNDNKGKHKHHDNTRTDPNKKSKVTCWKCRKPGHLKKDSKGVNVDNKANGSGTKGLNDDVAWWVDCGAIIHVCKDRCWFKTYESLNDGFILHIGNESTALLHEHGCVDLKFGFGVIVSLFNVLHVPNIRKNLGSSSVLNNCGYKHVIESNKFVLSKHGDVHFKRMQDMSKDGLLPAFNMDTKKTRDEVSDQHSYCFNVEDNHKTFDKAMKSQDVAFWKEAINDEMDSIMGNNTCVLADLPPGCKPLGCKLIFKRKLKVDGTIKKFKERLVIQGFKQKSRIDYFNTYTLVACISTMRLLIAMALIHNLIIHQMDVKTTFLNGDLDEEVDLTKEFLSSRFSMKDMEEADVILVSTPMDISKKLMPNNGQVISQLEYTSNPGTQHWQASQRVTLLQAGSATLKIIRLQAAGVATLEKAYSQMYNKKSRHLGVRHSMIRELITNGVISIEFVRSQQNLADHLTKGLAKDLVIKSAEGMGLKSN